MIGRLSGLRRGEARARAAGLLDQFDLADAADRMLKEYSGGMRRRLDLAAGLVTRPPVLFLDEPTTGLDPASRLRMWNVIRELVAGGVPAVLRFIADWNPVSAVTAAARHLFGNPNPSATIHAWPMQHPVAASLLWSVALLLIFAPFLYHRRTTG